MPTMIRPVPVLLAAVGLAALLLLSPQARAGEGRDNCMGYIDSLPTQVDTSGTWCLRANLSTAVTAGGGIQIGPNRHNIVIDCNGYRIENTTPGNRAFGMSLLGNNHVVRNCDVRGFFAGIVLAGENGRIEDNRLQDLGAIGVQVDPTITVQRNLILRVGGDTTFEGTVVGIAGGGDIRDNTIDSIVANAAINIHGGVQGIFVSNSQGVITRNRIRNLLPAGNGTAVGIRTHLSNSYITHNHIVGPALGKAGNYSIYCNGGETHAWNNIASGFAFTWTSGGTSGWTGSIVCHSAGGTNIDKT